MPTTYAHDLFGKMVYHRLDPEIQEKIKKYQTTYQIGLHGPDILFYVRPFHKNRFNQMAHFTEKRRQDFLNVEENFTKRQEMKKFWCIC